MAYSDYGAEVYEDGRWRADKEDCPLSELSQPVNGFFNYYHGVMGDGNIRVGCYKQGLPKIFELQGGKEVEIEYWKYFTSDIDPYEYDDITFEYKGYKFLFVSNKPYYAQMIEPDRTVWECKYDYGYGWAEE